MSEPGQLYRTLLNALPGRVRWLMSGRLHRLRWLRAAIPTILDADVSDALQVARGHLHLLGASGLRLAGMELLELGPGKNLGAPLIVASHGARVTVADRFLTGWDSRYHPFFYRRLRERWDGPADAIDRVIAAQSYPESVIRSLPVAVEELADEFTERFDAVLSNAVLEHVYDPTAACRSLARITRDGGSHFHQIDLRDHKDFARPLEFLLEHDEGYRPESSTRLTQRGNRWRLQQWIAGFQKVGFIVDQIQCNELASADYLDDLLTRLRRSSSGYRDWPAEDLKILGARLCLRLARPDSPLRR